CCSAARTTSVRAQLWTPSRSPSTCISRVAMMISCVFCSIAAEEAPSYNVAESDRAVAFLDINPAAAGHTLVIPKAHADDIWDLDPEDGRAVWSLAQEVAGQLSERLEPDGMTIFQANRKSGGQP